jgi:predicted  nucleic acid-binding Zn-ribbon protein
MTTPKEKNTELELTVENIGGISETTVDLSPGLTVLEGRNATNRTSFLRALMAALGSDSFTLKGDADSGRVELDLAGTVVKRRFERRNDGVKTTGEQYLDNPEIAELFAFLLEDNDARRAVVRGDNLRDILTRPIDTAEIEAEIERLQANKRDVEDHIEWIDERENDLLELERRREDLESTIEDRRKRLEELQAAVDEADSNVAAKRERKEAVEEQLDALKDRRSRLEDIRFDLETLRETVESLEHERESTQSELEELSVDPNVDPASLRSSLDDLRDRQRTVTAQLNELQSIIQFNEDMLEGTDSEIRAAIAGESDDDHGSVTDQLVVDEETVTCWTCGSQVMEDEIEATLESLRSFSREKSSERQSISDDIDETQERLSAYEKAKRDLDAAEERLAEVDTKLDRKRERIEDLEAEREAVHEEIEELESAVEAEQSSEYEELLDLHKEANRVELELEQAEDELASVESEIEDVESLVAERDEYENRRAQITDQLRELRNRIDRLEENAVESFNEHIAEVLDLLDYDNVARVWIERKEQEVREGRRKVSKNVFDLHIVRETESGKAYEGTVETLSESEQEVVGLVFALAGYLVHDLHESVPIMVLDSLEAIDSERIATLVEYFADYPEYLIVALLPEDAAAVDAEYETVKSI